MRIKRRYLLALLILAGFRPLAAAEPQPATPADAFVDSLGVNVHLHYTDTVYWDFGKLKAALKELGVRHIRDGLVYNGRKEYYERHRELGAAGVRSTLIVSGDLAKLAAEVEKFKPAAFALEGPNEVNLNGWKVADAQAYQATLWKTVKEHPALTDYPVVGLSYTDFKYGKQLGDLSPHLDFGNIHPYPGGWEPENKCNWMRADLPSGLASARDTCGQKPIWITEIGYTNAMNRKGGHVPLSAAAAGVYLPRIFLNCYRNGVQRTFWYELFDLKPDAEQKEVEHNFGLYHNDGATAKPAGRALRHLAELLADPGPAFTPKSLGFELSNRDVQAMLFQKRSGEYWLAVWLPVSLWDHSRPYGQKKEEDPADQSCTISFAAAPRSVTAYSRLDDAEIKTETLPAGREMKLTVSARVMLLQIR